jgi:hypothetical protein
LPSRLKKGSLIGVVSPQKRNPNVEIDRQPVKDSGR